MASLAILIGIFSYLIFGIGLLGKLTRPVLILLTLSFWIIGGYSFKSQFKGWLKAGRGWLKEVFSPKEKLSSFLTVLIVASVLVNLVGALGPELGFDALWYHLTLPKIYLQNQKILFIPGNLFYYSAMPKLIEMLYIAALAIGKEILVKFIHFLFGILSLVALYKLSRKFLNLQTSLMVSLIFYTSLVVGWQSITAYVDLGRTFFEILCLDYFLRWYKNQKESDLTEAAVMAGLAVSSKLLALASLPIFLFLIYLKRKRSLVKFLLFALAVSFPWFLFSFVQTGNFFYPLFSNILDSSHRFTSFSLTGFLTGFWRIFLFSADPTLPIFLVILPLLIINFKHLAKEARVVLLYCFLSYSIWYFLPRTGGGRFILPYLPAFSLLAGFVYFTLKEAKAKKIFMIFVLFIAVMNTAYRGMANYKFLPVILGQQSKTDFLTKNLNFEYGDFFDIDGFFKKNIKKEETVLTSGIHNLYYADFNFVDESWVSSGTPVTYILLRGESLPKKFGERRLIYQNLKTKVKLFAFGEKLP